MNSLGIGAFSLSLAVKDIKKSKEFYQKLGFQISGGNEAENWVVLRHDNCTIGLFQGMFDKNILTFNPGWNTKAEEINPFIDVRVLQEKFRQQGIKFIIEVNLDSEGPGYFMIEDPEGNPILVDQHR